MRPADDIKKLFEEAPIEADQRKDETILNKVLDAQAKAIEQRSALGRQSVWRIIMKSKMTKLAAAAVFIIGIFLLFDNGQKTLYAQVIEAIENAQTIHVVTENLNNGQWSKNSEVWYGSDKGIVETSWSNGERTDIRIDNGQYMWIYSAGNSFAKRSKTIDPIGVARKILNAEAFKKSAIREPSEDKVVDGAQHFAYVLSNPENTWRMISWLDENSRVRGWEKMRLLECGLWEKYRIGEVTYNIELNPKIFLPDFGEDVEILDVGKTLDAFGLDDALFVREELGMIFAVHELVRCNEGLIFTVSSIRPADAWRDAARAESGRFGVWHYGTFQFGSSWRRLDDYGRGHSYQPIKMAEVRQADLQVQWTLFLPQGFGLEEEGECELEVYMYTHGELSKKRKKAGLPTRERYIPMAVLDLPNESIALNKVLSEVHLTASELEPFVADNRLILKSIPFTDEEMDAYIEENPDSGETREYRSGDKSNRLSHGQSSKPSKINKDEWIKDRMDFLEELNNSYNDFLKEVKRRELRDHK